MNTHTYTNSTLTHLFLSGFEFVGAAAAWEVVEIIGDGRCVTRGIGLVAV